MFYENLLFLGGIFRKAFYASIGMAAAASICYPDQAVDISKQAWIFTKEQAKEFWRPVKSIKHCINSS